MSAKYREKVLSTSGISHRKFESEYGKKLMKQMGWVEGNGLGKNQHGETECVQLRRKEDNQGIGTKKEDLNSTDWKDQWWNDAYNNSIKNLKIKTGRTIKIRKEDTSSD